MRKMMSSLKQLQILIFFTFVMISTVTLLIGLITSSTYQNLLLLEQTETMTKQNVTRSSQALSAMFQTMEDTTTILVSQLQLNKPSKEAMHNLILSGTNLHRDIKSIVIYNDQGDVIDYSPSHFQLKEHATLVHQSSWYDASMQTDRSLYSKPHIQNLFLKEYSWVISNTVPFIFEGKKHLMVIDFNSSILERYFEGASIGARGYTFIVDPHNQIVYHPYQQLIASDLLKEDVSNLENTTQQLFVNDADQSVMATQRIGVNQWRVVGKTFLSDLVESAQKNIYNVTLLTFIMLFAVIAVASYFAAKYIARPIVNLTNSMNNQGKHEFRARVNFDAPYDEAQALQQSYNGLLDEVDELMGMVKEEQAVLRKTERNILEAQIQPHFLYNTLDSILWMIESGNNQEASQMVKSLGTLLRITLSKGAEYITLEKEFQHAQSYLEIQSIRYSTQFRYHFDLPDALKQTKVIKLILQPLVENAIYHGLSRMVDDGDIWIKATCNENMTQLNLIVKDNGLGMSEEKLATLRQHLVTKQAQFGIGLRNVNERIQIYYGGDFGISIESEQDYGTELIISLPLQLLEGGDQHD